jgi:hypothetical protein
MASTSIITALSIFFLLSYGLTKVLEFYGMDISTYGSYIAFYFFLLISYFILPSEYYKI